MMHTTSILKVFSALAIAASLSAPSLRAQKLTLVEIDRLDDVCDYVWWCAFHPDSNNVVMSGCSSNWLMRWKVGEDDVVSTVATTRAYELRKVAFSSDSSRAVSAGHSNALHLGLWNTSNWRGVGYVHILAVTRALFTPDDRAMVALTTLGIKVVDTATIETIREIGDQSHYPRRDMDISPDGTRLVVATDSGDVWMYDYASGEKLWSIKRRFPVYNIQFSPTGSKILITALEQEGPDHFFSEAAEYDAVSGEKVRSYTGHSKGINSARYNREGTRFVTTSYDTTVRVWSTESGEQLALLNVRALPMWAEFSKGGTRIVVTGEKLAGVWELQPVSSVAEPVAGGVRTGMLDVHPNPVRGSLTVPFELSVASEINLALYDALGKEVRVLASGVYEAGERRITSDLSGLPSGPYLVVLRSEEGVLHRQIHVIH